MTNTKEHNEVIQRALGRLEGMIVEVDVNAMYKAAANPLTVKILRVGDAHVEIHDYTYTEGTEHYPISGIDRISIGRLK